MLETFLEWFIYFIIYSFVGYLIEIIYVSFQEGKLCNRGFLFGPIVPIWGIGGVVMIWLLSRYQESPVAVFILGATIGGILESVVGNILETLFKNKWWDYSNRKDAITDYVCIGNMIGFGIGSFVTVCHIQPMVSELVLKIPETLLYLSGGTILFLLILDIIYSAIIAIRLKSGLILAEKWKSEQKIHIPIGITKKLDQFFASYKLKPIRILRAFPNLINSEAGKKIWESLNRLKNIRKKNRKS